MAGTSPAKTLLKGLRVLEAFDSGHRELSLTDVVRTTEIEISGARRLLATLVSAGYLRQDARTRRYRLSANILRWSVAYLGADPLVSCAYPILESVSRESGLQFELSVLSGDECVILLNSPGQKEKLSFVRGPSIGVREPVFCASTGLAMLSLLPQGEVYKRLSEMDRQKVTKYTVTNLDRIMTFLAETRERGFSLTDRSCYPRAISIGAAVVDYAGQPAGAVAVTVDVQEFSLARARRELSPIVVKAAQAITLAYQRST